jgi:hypothetical protein
MLNIKFIEEKLSIKKASAGGGFSKVPVQVSFV